MSDHPRASLVLSLLPLVILVAVLFFDLNHRPLSLAAAYPVVLSPVALNVDPIRVGWLSRDRDMIRRYDRRLLPTAGERRARAIRSRITT